MNERIKELWTQGTFNVVPRAGDYSSVSAEQIEKFAELIAKECLVQISEAIPDTNCSAAGAYQTAKLAATNRVKKHFGVE